MLMLMSWRRTAHNEREKEKLEYKEKNIEEEEEDGIFFSWIA